MMSNKLTTIALFTLLFLFSFTTVDAQRPGQCGGACNPGCSAGNTCRSGVCVQFSCTTSNPCCRSNKPRTPTRVPTAGNGQPNVPLTTPVTNVSKPPVDTKPITPVVGTPPVGGGTAGDCSGPVAEGVSDGKVDLVDFNLLRKEFSGSATTLFCDNDTNGVVDLLDFNIFRIAFIAQK